MDVMVMMVPIMKVPVMVVPIAKVPVMDMMPNRNLLDRRRG